VAEFGMNSLLLNGNATIHSVFKPSLFRTFVRESKFTLIHSARLISSSTLLNYHQQTYANNIKYRRVLFGIVMS